MNRPLKNEILSFLMDYADAYEAALPTEDSDLYLEALLDVIAETEEVKND